MSPPTPSRAGNGVLGLFTETLATAEVFDELPEDNAPTRQRSRDSVREALEEGEILVRNEFNDRVGQECFEKHENEFFAPTEQQWKTQPQANGEEDARTPRQTLLGLIEQHFEEPSLSIRDRIEPTDLPQFRPWLDLAFSVPTLAGSGMETTSDEEV